MVTFFLNILSGSLDAVRPMRIPGPVIVLKLETVATSGVLALRGGGRTAFNAAIILFCALEDLSGGAADVDLRSLFLGLLDRGTKLGGGVSPRGTCVVWKESSESG